MSNSSDLCNSHDSNNQYINKPIKIPRFNNLLLPFCIYYKQDTETGVVYSHLGAPELAVDLDGKNPRYQCMSRSILYRGWKPYGMFYSLDPQFRPIPRGMALMCARWRRGFPYHTFEIRHIIDPYNLETDLYSGCMYFFAYTHPALNTVPLYFYTMNMYIQGGNLFLPSFERDIKKLPQPGKKNGIILNWKRAHIPVLYVLAPERISHECKKCFSSEEIEKIRFSNINNSCVPDPNGIYSNIGECIVSSDQSKNINLVEMVQEDSKKDIGIRKFFKSIPLYAISIILFVFVLSLLIVIILSTQNTK